jgi:anaerobic ribonucleoside-triphosphate reductase
MVALIKKGKPMFQELEYSSKTGRLAKNIKNTLVQTLINNYKIEDIKKAEKVANVILKAHGMAAANFDFVKNVEQSISAQFKQDTTAGEVDPNSNKGESSIKQILADAQGAFSKILGYDYLYRTMKEMYGKEEAKRLSGELYSFALALSDSTQILSPYCYAADFSKLVIEGRPWGNIHSAPAKRVDSYVQQVLETVHEMSNHLAGAIAISTFFFDIAHLIMYKDGVNTALKNVTLEDVKNDKIIRKSLENLFQTVIHSVNHTSRNGSESPFTNISIFDKTKIKSVKDTVPHLFMEPAGFDSEEEKENYIVELIYELQNIYMGIFEKGDQLNDNRPVTFPVTTLNMSKDPKDDGTYEITDTEALKDFSNRQMYRYNINVSAGNRIAMCCRFSNDYDLMKSQAQTVNSFGGEGIAIGSHRVNTINLKRVALEAKDYKSFLALLDKRVEDAIKILKAHKELIKYTAEKKLQKFISNGWVNLNNLFSTVGIIGSYEMSETLKEKFKDKAGHFDKDYIEEALRTIEASVEKYSREYEVYGNIEEIPGESMAVKLPKVDKVLFGEELVYEEMYSNQFIPLWHDSTIYERMEADGKYQQLLTGGGIVHFQLGSLLTPLQNENLVIDAVKAGCEHFAGNPVTCTCENGHNTIGDFNTDHCVICNSAIVDKRTRVVGFSTSVNNWNEVRRTWEAPRRTTYNLS